MADNQNRDAGQVLNGFKKGIKGEEEMGKTYSGNHLVETHITKPVSNQSYI